MGSNQLSEPLNLIGWQILTTFGPLWLFMLAVVFIRILLVVYQKRRLARSGIFEIDQMDGITFEQYLELLFRKLGYKAERTQASGDFGADLVISKDGVRTIVQAKRYAKNIGVRAVQEVVAAQKMYNGTKAMVVTNRGYTKQAQQLAKANNVELWDREQLVSAILSVQKR